MKTQVLSLESMDQFYLFSDGFQDQFGGTNDKRYMKKRFREFLHNISKHSFEKQARLVEEEFLKWKGNTDQTNDVLVVGIKPKK
ncbi:MAG: hypothetical protein GY827_01680 [Cytophagales bacterium]|nr:hypothetical protein [Cytophagales bacterium]